MKHLLAIVFFLSITVIGLFGLYDQQTVDTVEKRKLADFPEPGSETFFVDFSAYLNDHFGFRRFFVDANEKILRVFWLMSSEGVVPNRASHKGVVAGREGYLFLDMSVDYYENKFDEERIDLFISELQQFASSVGEVPVVVALVPNRTWLLEGYLPPYVRRSDLRERTVEKLQQLEGVAVVDFYPVLSAAQQQGQQIVFRYDTHWNARGALLSYQHLIDQVSVFYNLPLQVPSSQPGGARQTWYGDLAQVAGRDDLMEEYETIVFPGSPVITRENSYRLLDNSLPDYHNPAGHGSVIILHDSFTEKFFGEYLAQSFADVHTLSTFNFSRVLPVINRDQAGVQADLIIVEIVDRHMFSGTDQY